ncbi:MAG: response regulator [Bacteroidetes bacterium]|nr:response regulator [Bacteroidota bacterium]
MENQTPYKLLLIDDDEVDIMQFERALKKTGLNQSLHICKNAQETLEIIAKEVFDCIFLDYQLPGIDGLQLLKKIRDKDVLTPVAVLTSQGDEKVAVQMIKSGAFDYFSKSDITPDSIQKVVISGIRLWEVENQRRRAEEEIKVNNYKLNAILESTTSIIFAVDKQLNLLSFNSTFKHKIKERTLREVKEGMNIAMINFKNSERENIISSIDRSLQGEQFTQVEEFEVNENIIYQETTYNPIFAANNEVTGVAVYSQDITEKKKFEQDLLQARNDAIAAAKAKSDFLSNMSHEIRTPMNAILGLTDLLLEENFEGSNLENLKSIKYSADNLLVIINDILDFSKIEAGKITFESIDFDLRLRMAELKKTFDYRAKEKGLEFNVTVPDNVPNYIKGDPYRLNQILFNLVGNAIKFTSKGFVEVKTSINARNDDKISLIFDIVDSGIGVPEHKQNKIFESFTQAYTDTTRKFGGTGLGLAITKNLTMLQGGTISIKSKVGSGTTFTVEIPFEIGNPDALEKQDKTEKDLILDLSEIKILLVEDNLMNQFVAKQFFKKWNNEISIANNGIEAIEILALDGSFDLVLMDLQMPELSGFEATEVIRAEHTRVKNRNIPIIALSADAFQETRRKVLEAGMNDFVTKPFKPEELYHKIVKYKPLKGNKV